jgi:site-specific DNA-methyltransferase (adenine-specific)
MTKFYDANGAVVYNGDCLEVLRGLEDNSVDSIVTDPPYGLSNTDPDHVVEAISKWAAGERDFTPAGKGFMGKAWDAFVPPPAVWDECFRVLKPGGHMLVFAGSRTQDLMGLSVRMAGFEIRDGIAWIYGSGFPKSMDISKAIDKAAGAKREVVGVSKGVGVDAKDNQFGGINRGAVGIKQVSVDIPITAPATDEAKHWEGWGTALKPALEPIVVARKPVSEKTVAANVLKWGVGGINIDGTRVGNEEVTINTFDNGAKPWGDAVGEPYTGRKSVGRWPANVMFTHAEDCVEVGSVVETISNHNAPQGTFAGGEPERGSDTSEYRDYEVSTAVFECVDGCPVKEVNRQSGVSKSKAGKMAIPDIRSGKYGSEYGAREDIDGTVRGFNDAGGASRFFYVAKASKKDRNEGLVDHNAHPTVKPTSLMRELVRLVTPRGGVVLDPFTGSGSTGKAAILEGFDFVGVELTSEYLPIIEGRLNHAAKQVDGQLEF